MDLSVSYLGLKLAHPLMPGASPLVDNIDTVRQLEDAGASAIVMHSLFEEQISGEHLASVYHMEMYANSYAEAMSFFPGREEFALGPDEYLLHIGRIKRAVSVPVIASLNGCTLGGWIEHAKMVEQAGADALELNVYHLATDPVESGASVEQRVLDVARAVKSAVQIPVAVKLSPFFSSLTNLCCQLNDLGIDGVVLFNRFYQPDVDLEQLDAVPKLHLSDPTELALRLRWAAIITPHLTGSVAISGGVHGGTDAVKAVMVGASAVQVVSALLRHGPQHLSKMLDGMKEWMEQNEYTSMRLMQGCMSHARCPDPQAFERANYMRVLQSWRASH
jgi:dihydroorotate dehydrogenase (fumarate)